MTSDDTTQTIIATVKKCAREYKKKGDGNTSANDQNDHTIVMDQKENKNVEFYGANLWTAWKFK